MPSLLDLLEHDHEAPSTPEPSDQMLAAVRSEGGRRRTVRQRRTAGLALAGLLLLGAPVVALQAGGDDGRGHVDVATGGDAASEPIPDPALPPLPPTPVPNTAPEADAVPEPSTTLAPTGPVPSTGDRTATTGRVTTVTTASSVPPGTTGTTALVCRNSDDPACGPRYWDPAPAPNQPLEARFTSAPSNAATGQTVTFEVAWSDGDAALTYDHFSQDGARYAIACSPPPGYGPWTPPDPVPSSGTKSYTAVFPSAGEYRVVVTLNTSSCKPYGDQTHIETLIVVTEPTLG